MRGCGVLYATMQVYICVTPDRPAQNTQQSSFFEVLSYPLIYAAILPSFINGLITCVAGPN